jgi:hypothetical protein
MLTPDVVGRRIATALSFESSKVQSAVGAADAQIDHADAQSAV